MSTSSGFTPISIDLDYPQAGHSVVTLPGGSNEFMLFSSQDPNATGVINAFKLSPNDNSAASFSIEPVKPLGKPPVPLSHAAVCIVNKKAFLFGGKQLSDDAIHPNLIAIDTSRKTFLKPRSLGSLPTPRFGHTMTLVGNKVHLFGGYTEGNTPSDEYYVLNPTGNIWTKPKIAGLTPPARAHHDAVLIVNKLFVFGGKDESNNKTFSDLWCYNTDKNEWTMCQFSGDAPKARSHHSMTVINDLIYLYGGMDQLGNSLNDIYSLDPSDLTWKYYGEASADPRHSHSAFTAFDQFMVVLGGDNVSDSFVVDVSQLVEQSPQSSSSGVSANQVASKMLGDEITDDKANRRKARGFRGSLQPVDLSDLNALSNELDDVESLLKASANVKKEEPKPEPEQSSAALDLLAQLEQDAAELEAKNNQEAEDRKRKQEEDEKQKELERQRQAEKIRQQKLAKMEEQKQLEQQQLQQQQQKLEQDRKVAEMQAKAKADAQAKAQQTARAQAQAQNTNQPPPASTTTSTATATASISSSNDSEKDAIIAQLRSEVDSLKKQLAEALQRAETAEAKAAKAAKSGGGPPPPPPPPGGMKKKTGGGPPPPPPPPGPGGMKKKAGGGPPPPPPPGGLKTGGGGGGGMPKPSGGKVDLLAEIRKGKQLKKAPKPSEKPKESSSGGGGSGGGGGNPMSMAAMAAKMVQERKARMANLDKQIGSRPSKQDLVNKNIMPNEEDAKPGFRLRKVKDNLEEKIENRPSTEELELANILQRRKKLNKE